MFFQQLADFLKSLDGETEEKPDLRVAVAVLLIEAAQRDGEYSADERAVIGRLLTEKFSLAPAERDELLSACEARNASLVQLHPYTSILAERMTMTERIGVIEMLWEVVYADGVLDPEEDALIRRLGALIHVDDRDRVLARQRVLARMR